MAQTLALPRLVEAPPADDPFRYGTRFATRWRPDGTPYTYPLPLTLWDVLHPQEADHIAQSGRHQKEVRYLTSVIEARYAHDAQTVVLSDTLVYWDVPGLASHSPDVVVIRDVRRPQEVWPSFSVTQEGVRPSLIIEVVSPHTRSNDVDTKLVEYHHAMVPLYVIIDRQHEDDWPTLLAYRYTPEQYEPIALDDRDCLLLEDAGLRLCVNQNRVTCYDAETGEELGDYQAVSEALEAEVAARQAAEEAARLAEEKASAEAEGRRQAEEAARLAKEKADAEAESRRQAEERLQKERAAYAELERQLRELQARLPPAE